MSPEYEGFAKEMSTIAEGQQLLRAAARLDRPGPFQVQASIAACHVSRDGETDWAEIAVLYDRLSDMAPSAVIELNRAVAVSLSEGPEAGLALLATSSGVCARRRPHRRFDRLGHRCNRLARATARRGQVKNENREDG